MMIFTTPEQAARKFSAKLITEGYAPKALHTYTDADNNILYRRIRLKNSAGKKWIRPMYRDEKNQYHLAELPTLNNQSKPLYGLHLIAQHPLATILIVEGEHPADVLNQRFSKHLEDHAVCAITSGSATSADNANWEPLAKRNCIIWPDNDAAGLRYAQQACAKLENLGCTVQLLNPARLQLIEPIQTEDDTITRLSALAPIEYDRVRITEAKILNIRPSTLDHLVKATKQMSKKENKTPFPEVEPWHAPIHPAELLTDIKNVIHRFINCPPETAHAATLWIAMTWFINVIRVAPLAVITAPEKRCGKSQLLFLFGRLTDRPLSASNITPAALFRSIDAWQPTLLIDEADSFMRENEELRGIINCGHTLDSAKIIRVVGDDYTPTAFIVWGAKALAGIGHLSGTIMDRSITLELRRKLINEKTERLRHAEPDLFKTLSAKLARFAEDYSDIIQNAKPELPDTLNDRAQDNWEPLFAIADVAGGEWPKLARMAAAKISGDNEQSQSIGVELLTDIQEIFETKTIDRISSAELIGSLCEDEEKF